MPKKKTEWIVEKVVDQAVVANTVVQFLEIFKNNSVEQLMNSGLSRDDIVAINNTLNSQLEVTKSKAFEYVSKL